MKTNDFYWFWVSLIINCRSPRLYFLDPGSQVPLIIRVPGLTVLRPAFKIRGLRFRHPPMRSWSSGPTYDYDQPNVTFLVFWLILCFESCGEKQLLRPINMFKNEVKSYVLFICKHLHLPENYNFIIIVLFI